MNNLFGFNNQVPVSGPEYLDKLNYLRDEVGVCSGQFAFLKRFNGLT